MLYIALVLMGIVRYQFLTVVSIMFSVEFLVFGDLKSYGFAYRIKDNLWPLLFFLNHL